jgi:hypothetical protein
MRHPLKRPKHATVVAYLALFAALAGGAYAAATVNSGDVVNNSLKSVDLKNNAGVKGTDVKNSSLRGNDIANDSVTGADVKESSLLAARIVARLGGPMSTPLGLGAQSAIPNATYTQVADSLDQVLGDATVTFAGTCTSPRQAEVFLLRNFAPPIGPEDVIAGTQISDSGAGALTRTQTFGGGLPGLPGNYTMPSGSPQPTSFSVYGSASCNSGSGVTLDGVHLAVLGAR